MSDIKQRIDALAEQMEYFDPEDSYWGELNQEYLRLKSVKPEFVNYPAKVAVRISHERYTELLDYEQRYKGLLK